MVCNLANAEAPGILDKLLALVLDQVVKAQDDENDEEWKKEMQELKKINNDDIDFTLPASAIENTLPIKFAEDEILQKIE